MNLLNYGLQILNFWMEIFNNKYWKLQQKIRLNGPITVADYMRMTISLPMSGYYQQFSNNHEIFGHKGDFITAPEISQLFGEMIGVWCYYEVGNAGHKGEWQLVECGPGTGQFMNDISRTLDRFKEKKFSIHLVEISDSLIKKQENILCNSITNYIEGHPYIKSNITKYGIPIFWYRSVDEIPTKFSVFIANEFLDALPIHQFQKDDVGQWHEIYIALNENDQLYFMLSKGENLYTKGLIPEKVRRDHKRTVWELCPDACLFVSQIAERITQYGGIGLLIDYGHDGQRSTLSLRAYKNHQLVNPLKNPGKQDITADIDFGYLRSLIEEQTQGLREFLTHMGIGIRLNRLLQSCSNEKDRENLVESYKFLMSDEGMGSRFKVMSIYPKVLYETLIFRQGPAGFPQDYSRNILGE
ncbi:unnamed protein product [Dracunculus medinensis]|uniref:Protein arginine methyltransferase NDUFAF7 n=1 Tax=Dracunculus medinensis TaxID=318479 RepID=A0A3P7PR68_DRAME|nr:unnamed protein product [Dracunculus medinensis]